MDNHFGENCVMHQLVYGIETRYLGMGTIMTQAADMQRHAPTKILESDVSILKALLLTYAEQGGQKSKNHTAMICVRVP